MYDHSNQFHNTIFVVFWNYEMIHLLNDCIDYRV